jgi:hypothetical protein
VTQSCVSKWEDANTIPGNISCVPDARVKIAADHHPVIVERLEQGETQEQVAADYQVTHGSCSLQLHPLRNDHKRGFYNC